MSEIVIRQAEGGGTVPARLGDILVVELPESPTTGFRWVSGVSDNRLFRLQHDDFLPAGVHAIGCGGLRVFRYQTTGRGTADLEFKLQRAWEPGNPSATFFTHVHIS